MGTNKKTDWWMYGYFHKESKTLCGRKNKDTRVRSTRREESETQEQMGTNCVGNKDGDPIESDVFLIETNRIFTCLQQTRASTSFLVASTQLDR